MEHYKSALIACSLLVISGCAREELAPYEQGKPHNIIPISLNKEIIMGPRMATETDVPVEEKPQYRKYEKPISVVEHQVKDDDFDDAEPIVKKREIVKNQESVPVKKVETVKKSDLVQKEIRPVSSASVSNKLVDGGKIVTKFGEVVDGYQSDGILIKAPLGSSVRSIRDGEVIYAGSQLKEYGNIVVVKHKNDLISTYAHLQKINVKKGDIVKAGTELAKSGKSGDAKFPQLYFQLMQDSRPINPISYIKI